MPRQIAYYPISQFLNAKAATGASPAIPCREYRNAVIQLSAPTNSSLTYKFVGAIGDTAPDFTAAQSATNVYDFLEVVDLEDGTAYDGDEGIVIDNTPAEVNCRLFEVNTNVLDYVGVVVSAYTDGSLSASIALADNN